MYFSETLTDRPIVAWRNLNEHTVHSGSDVTVRNPLLCKKAGKFFEVTFLNFHIYFVSEQGNRFGANIISLGYLGYLNF